MQPDKIFKTVVCHEFGHVLAFLLSGGQVADVDTIEFQNTAANVDGHTKINPLYDMPTDQKIFMLFGGIAAENVCGYSTAFLHPGTDADKLNTITDKGRQKTVKKAVLDALTPYKKTLDALTAATIADYTRQGCPDYYRIFHDSIINYYYTMIDQNQTPEPEPATDADQTPEPGANSERTPRNREPEPEPEPDDWDDPHQDEKEQLLAMLQNKFDDAKTLKYLPCVPPGVSRDIVLQNDCGCYVAVGDWQFNSLVDYFLRAAKIDGKYYYYAASFC